MFQKNYTLHFFLLNILLIGIVSCQYTMTGSSSSEPSNNTETVQATPVNNTASNSNEPNNNSSTTATNSESTTEDVATSTPPQNKNLFTNLPALSTAFQNFYNAQKYNIDQINAIHFIDVNEDFENDALFLFATTNPGGGNAFGLQMALFTKTKEGYTFVDQEAYGGKFNTMGFTRYNTQNKEVTFKPIATFTGEFTSDGKAVVYKVSDKDISLVTSKK